jgi:hypothetical protein
MTMSGQTQGVFYDYDGDIQYKITYYSDEQRFTIFKQFYDENGKYRRLTMRRVDINDYDRDLDKLKRYIREELIGKDSRGNNEAEEKPLKGDIHSEANEASGSKSEQLKILFAEWENAQENEPNSLWKITNGGNKNIGKAHFRRDGIIDENIYKNETRKVLFISAEADDNDYSARTREKTDTIKDYLEYHRTGKDDWNGKMREHLAEIYKVICGIGRNDLPNNEAVLHFAVMDINKRGGGSDIKSGNHIKEYCRYYANYIRREIEIIDPDIVAIIGTNLYDMQLHSLFLGAESKGGGKYFFNLKGKLVPILRLYQTSYYQGQNEPLPGYNENRIIGKQAAKCAEELERFGIR